MDANRCKWEETMAEGPYIMTKKQKAVDKSANNTALYVFVLFFFCSFLLFVCCLFVVCLLFV
jgi:hypothetical protein